MTSLKVEYNSSVHTQAGFRHVTIQALAERVSDKRVKVLEVLSIDNEAVQNNMSRTGANRQRYYGTGVALREEGKIKNLSACTII